MGTALYGWIEIARAGGWEPLLKTDEFLVGPKTWWREGLFGDTKGTETLYGREERTAYFDPVPYTPGVPHDLSDVVRFDVFGDRREDGAVTIRDPDEAFLRPERDLFSVSYETLQAVDRDEPRNDIDDVLEDALERFDASWMEAELVGEGYRFERRDADGAVADRSVHGLPREVALATIQRTTPFRHDLLDACPTAIPNEHQGESGPVQHEASIYVQSDRRDAITCHLAGFACST